MKIRKAIIPVAGWGTRRLPITKVIEKAMLPVGNRPLVDYAVQDLAQAGVTDIYIVVSNLADCQIKKYYEQNTELEKYLEMYGKEDKIALARTLPKGVQMHFVEQDHSANAKYGTAVPIALVAKKFEIDEPVMVFMGDDFVWNPGGIGAAESLLRAAKDGESAMLTVSVEPEKLEKYGALMVENGFLTGIKEKPKPSEVDSDLINISKYLMTPELIREIMRYVDSGDLVCNGQEYMVTVPMMNYVNNGGKIRTVLAEGQYLDGGSLEGWLNANNVVN